MQDEVARRIACRIHAGQQDRFGEPVVDHVARVAAAVPPSVRATAWLHDVAERSSVTAEELRAQGLTVDELDALQLLTRTPSESCELYTLRIAGAVGEAGRIARIVKLADLDDHIGHRVASAEAPPYEWARRRIAVAHEREVDAQTRSSIVGAVGRARSG
jgi:hypothetical protein